MQIDCSNTFKINELSSLTYIWVRKRCIKRNNLKDSKRDKVCGCLNCGHKHSEIKAQVGTVLYCKDCNKYEHIVHISEAGISTSERLEREELFQLLSEGRVRIVDDDDMKDNGLSVSN